MAEINNAMNNPPNQHNNHKGDDRSLTSASTTCHIKGKTPTSSGTAMNSCSGTGSFKNYGTGRQNFYNATINSDPCVKNRTGSNNVVYDGGGGPQDFRGAKINGLTVTPSSGTPSSSRSQTTSGVLHGTGTRRSFTNHKNGSQSFEGANINNGADLADL
ncbi:hypothetical protein E2542_SST16722 [Spatholobus suberectus]|nr:hypothetical protein E2542_SST16722 [Spatholobus suberectus]